MEEWDIYDRNCEKIGKTCIRGKYQLQENEYHLVVHIWLFTQDGKILLTQRAPNKETAPLKWECIGGSIVKGENPIDGAIRELKEEIGIELKENDLHLFRQERREHYNDFFFAYYTIVPEEIINKIQFADGEVIDKKWVTIDEFINMLKKETVQNIYYIKEEYCKLSFRS